jgi:DNA-binding response OmpR family regulator
MTPLDVTILDTEQAGGDWLLKQLNQIHVSAKWLPNASDLLAEAEEDAPTVCLVALRPPVAQVHALITHLTQEPRFAKTAFIVMGPAHYKHAAFEAGADDYLSTPPDVIELRKRVRLYLDRAALAARVVAETRLVQEMDALSDVLSGEQNGGEMDRESLTLLEHAAALTEERTLFDLILTHTAEAISLVDPDGTLLYGNPAYWVLVGDKLGVQVGEPIGWPPVTDQAGVNQAIADAIERALPWRGDVELTLPNGERLRLAMSIQPAFDANQHLAGFVVTQQAVAE